MFLRNWLFLLGFGVWGKLGFTFAGQDFCCKTVLFLPFHVSFYRQQRSRIKECFGIKDCQAQFIHIRIKRFWRRRSRHFNFGNGMMTSVFSHLQTNCRIFFFLPQTFRKLNFLSEVTFVFFALPFYPPFIVPSLFFFCTCSSLAFSAKHACVLS